MGPSINDITHLRGEGDLSKGDISPYSYLVKWAIRRREGLNSQKMGDIIYGRLDGPQSKI